MKQLATKRHRSIPGLGPVAFGLMLLGFAVFVRAQDAPPVQEQKLTSYESALLNYKSGHFDVAQNAIDAAEKANPGNPSIEILKARILTELSQFDEANKALNSLTGNPGMTPELSKVQALAMGDLCLRRRDFPGAVKMYEGLLSAKPGDPDLTLKVIYARIGAADLVTAAKYASQLKPIDATTSALDPEHPGVPVYYFAKAALAQATGKTDEAEENIQNARTVYGITVTNRYLKTFLEVFTASDKKDASAPPAPSAPTNAAPVSK